MLCRTLPLLLAAPLLALACGPESLEDCGLGEDPSGAPCGCTPRAGCEPDGMVLVPSGPFVMGSSDYYDEEPIHTVDLPAFYIDRTEVTVADYAACMQAGACDPPGGSETPDESESTQDYCNFGIEDRDDHPINCVDWFQAEAYCAWVDQGTRRLPTEPEWEKAARGTEGWIFPWGNEPEASCTHVVMGEQDINGCGQQSTWPVGSKPLGASPYGALDMAGNVWEWTDAWYEPYDPAQAGSGLWSDPPTQRVIRGAGFSLDYFAFFTTSNRAPDLPTRSRNSLGLRCAR